MTITLCLAIYLTSASQAPLSTTCVEVETSDPGYLANAIAAHADDVVWTDPRTIQIELALDGS